MRATIDFLLHDWTSREPRSATRMIRRKERRAAMRYYFAHEPPKIGACLTVVSRRDATCRDMQESWF